MKFVAKRKAMLALAVLAACAVPLAAQQVPRPGAADPARVTGGSYKADPHHTLVRWEVDHLGITPYFGIFGDVTGTLSLDPKNISAARVAMTIPVAKVTTASAALTAHLLRPPAKAGGKPDFFGSSPAEARFVSTSVTPGAGPTSATVNGNLTLNGVTRPVSLDVEFHGAGKMPAEMGGAENVGFVAETTIKRSDFGIELGVPGVSDEVDLDIVAAFSK